MKTVSEMAKIMMDKNANNEDANNENANSETTATKTVVYLIWRSPYMTINGSTYISKLLTKVGFVNLFAHAAKSYPKLDRHDTKEVKPDYVFLAADPYPFREKHIYEAKLTFPGAKIMLIDGDVFKRYGHPDKQPDDYFKELFKYLTSED